MREIFEKIFNEKTKIKIKLGDNTQATLHADELYPLLTYIEELELNLSHTPISELTTAQIDFFNEQILNRIIDEPLV